MTVSKQPRLAFRATAVIVLFVGLSGFSLESLFAPKAELWPRWQAHDAASTQAVDHGEWDMLLKAYVKPDATGLNRFDYQHVSSADRDALRRYIDGLGKVPVSKLNRREQFAYWINLYNALTIDVVLTHLPVQSIRDIDISPGLFASGPWDKKLLAVEGVDVSLNDIEHRILRPIWRDPRVHYGVNCASVGCPNLLTEAYTGAAIDKMLDAAARAYVNTARGAKIDENGLTVSSIYVWFKDDFGGTDQGVIDHLKRYAKPDLRAALEGRSSIDAHAYDWALNAGLGT